MTNKRPRRTARYIASQYDMPIPDRPHDGEFATFAHWCDSATRKIGGENALCVDAINRICCNGADFMRARDEGSFPVRYYFNAGNQTAAEQARQARLADRMLHPWRRGTLKIV